MNAVSVGLQLPDHEVHKKRAGAFGFETTLRYNRCGSGSLSAELRTRIRQVSAGIGPHVRVVRRSKRPRTPRISVVGAGAGGGR